MIDNLYQYQKDLKHQGVYLSVTGPFSQILMEGIANILKQKMQMENVQTTTTMNVFSVVVEHVQNIIRYSAEKISTGLLEQGETESRLGTLVIGYEEDRYFVVSGNLIDNTRVEKFRQRLTQLQQMNQEELKQFYKAQRRKGPDEDSKGAGLGLIDLARKASRPLEFDFRQIDEQSSFFSLKTII